MLARFAAALQRGQIQGVGGQGFGGGGGTIVVDDNCLVCWPRERQGSEISHTLSSRIPFPVKTLATRVCSVDHLGICP